MPMQRRAFFWVLNLVVDRDLDGIAPIGLNHWLYSISQATYRWVVSETYPRELAVDKECGLLEAIRCYGPPCDCEVTRSHDSGIRCVHVWVRIACAFGPPRIAICNGLVNSSVRDFIIAKCYEYDERDSIPSSCRSMQRYSRYWSRTAGAAWLERSQWSFLLQRGHQH